MGEGESSRIQQEGDTEAKILRNKIESYGDPRLYALSLVSRNLADSRQPLVPERLFNANSAGEGGFAANGMLGTLMSLLVAEKSGFELNGDESLGNPEASAKA